MHVCSLKHPTDGLEIRRNRERVAPETIGAAIAVDPGSQEITVTAPGKLPWSVLIDVPPGPTTMTLTIPELKDAPDAAAAHAESPEREPLPTPEPAPHSSSTTSEPSPKKLHPIDGGSGFGRTAMWGLAGLGLVGAAGGVVMGLEFRSNDDAARAICPSSRDCSNDDILRHNELVDAANRARTWAFVSGGVGGAMLVGAAILWLTSDDSSSDSAWVATPVFTADGGSLFFSGRY